MTEAHPYEDFTRHAFYRAVNEKLVALAHLKPGQVVVDIASGTGAMIKPILERIQAGGADGRVIALDHDAGALAVSRQRYGDAGISYVAADAGDLKGYITAADAVICANSLHMIEDKANVFSSVRKILKPDGVFAFNTTFFEGAVPVSTGRFYINWMLKARQILRGENVEVVRVKGERVAALRQLTAGQYHRMLEEFGFMVRHLEMQIADMTRESFEDISQFPDFAEGARLGVPISVATGALRRAASQAWDAMSLSCVPRRWLQVVCEISDLPEARRD